MPTTIKLKNSVTTTSVPSSLVQGEVAINVTDKKVWVGNAATTPIQLLGGGADGNFTNISVSSVATFGAGTVSAPSITTTGDTNTGIFFPAADTIAFTEGGVESMRISSTGTVAIGTTTTPTAKLWVESGRVGLTNAYKLGWHSNPAHGDLANYITGDDGSNYVALGTNGSERMRIDSSGKVLIGTTTSPSAAGVLLTVSGASAAYTEYNKGTDGGGVVGSEGTGLLFYTYTGNIGSETYTERMRITSGGEVYIAGTADQGAYNLQCNGTGVWGAGAYVNGSDARIKEDIEPIQSGLDVVEKLNPVTYRYKEEWSKDQSTQTGFIAQELLTALDGQVYVDGVVQQGGEYMSVAYQNIIPILTKSIQELHEIVKAQAAEIALLKLK